MDIPDMQSYIVDAKEEATRQKAKRPDSKAFGAWVDGQISGYEMAEKILVGTVPLTLETRLRDAIDNYRNTSVPTEANDVQYAWKYWYGVGTLKATRELYTLVDV